MPRATGEHVDLGIVELMASREALIILDWNANGPLFFNMRVQSPHVGARQVSQGVLADVERAPAEYLSTQGMFAWRCLAHAKQHPVRAVAIAGTLTEADRTPPLGVVAVNELEKHGLMLVQTRYENVSKSYPAVTSGRN